MSDPYKHVATVRFHCTQAGWEMLHRMFSEENVIPGLTLRAISRDDVFAERDVLEDALKKMQFGDVDRYEMEEFAEEALDEAQRAGMDAEKKLRAASGIVTEGGDAPAAPGAERLEPGGEAETHASIVLTQGGSNDRG